MYEAPTIFYSDEEDTVENMVKDLKEQGISTVHEVKLSSTNIKVARQRIGSELTTPFIYFPAKKKTDLKKVAKYVGVGVTCGVGAVVAAPFVLSALGFGSTGIVGGSVAAGIQSAVYGAFTGGVFSILQSAGVVGFGIFANTALGMAGAGLGMGITKLATNDNLQNLDIKVNMHIYGLYRNTSKKEDIKDIDSFVKNLKLKDEKKVKFVECNSGVQGFLKNITPAEDEVHLPAVIVCIKVTACKKRAIEMYEAPTIFFLDEKNAVENMAKDLKEHGISTMHKVKLSSTNIKVARQRIGSELTTPFIYFPAKSKPDLLKFAKYVGVGVACGVGAVVAAPLVLSALGFGSTGIAGGSVAAGIQSAVYGAFTGGVFSILQSAGVVGFGIFANTVFGMAGAGLGMGITKLATNDNLQNFDIKVNMKIYGLYRNTSKKEDIKDIDNFVKNLKLKDGKKVKLVECNSGVQGFLKNITPAENEVHLPAVIVCMEVTACKKTA